MLLRIQNCLKRAQDLAQVPGRCALVISPRARISSAIATVDGETQSLTHKVRACACWPSARQGVSRDEILDRAWSADDSDSRTVDNSFELRKLVIRRIRRA